MEETRLVVDMKLGKYKQERVYLWMMKAITS